MLKYNVNTHTHIYSLYSLNQYEHVFVCTDSTKDPVFDFY